MSSPHRFILEPYKGPSTRYTCPGCDKRKEFTRYVDTETGELLPEHVGKCNRADQCGYHYPPRDYFRDGGTRPDNGGTWTPKPEPTPRPPYLHDRAEVAALRAYPERNTLSAYWRNRIGADRWDKVAKDYALGTWSEGRLAGAAVYWQVDIHGHVKAGKIMQYDTATGHRAKGSGTGWVHFERYHKSASDLNVEQCLFGEHLLNSWPMEKPVAVVESEKTAMIAAALVLGAAGLAGALPPVIGWAAATGTARLGARLAADGRCRRHFEQCVQHTIQRQLTHVLLQHFLALQSRMAAHGGHRDVRKTQTLRCRFGEGHETLAHQRRRRDAR